MSNLLLKDFKMATDRYEMSGRIVKELGKEVSYDLAISILNFLADSGFCIWQTYTKDNLKQILGKQKLSKEDMDEYAYRLQDFESIRG